MKILAFIPARAGSKRVENKNIRLLNGKPLIVYTIEAARKSKYINRIVVSTDSEEIASVSKQYGAEVPFLRPEEISQSDSTEMQFFEHALDWFLKNEDYEPDLTVYIQNASIYITRHSTIRNKKSPTGDLIVPFIMDEMESVDINTPLDFRFAEMVLESMTGEQ